MFLSLFLPLHEGLDYPFPEVIIMAERIARLVYYKEKVLNNFSKIIKKYFAATDRTRIRYLSRY